MGEHVIPLHDLRRTALPLGALDKVPAPNGLLSDRRGRPLRDLRISVTDRCRLQTVSAMSWKAHHHHTMRSGISYHVI